MNKTTLWNLAFRVRPELRAMESQQQMLATIPVILVLIHLPLAILSLVWLTAITDPAVLRDHGLSMAALLVTLIVMNQFTFSIYMESANGDMIPATGSLEEIVTMSAALIYGPTMLWIVVASTAINTIQNAQQAHQIRQPNFWGTLSLLAQGLGRSLPADLAGLAVFTALGGDFPLSGLAVDHWLPAVVGVSISTVTDMILLAAFMLTINWLLASAMPIQGLTNLFKITVLLSGVLIPFPILGALIKSEASSGLYWLFLSGVVLVNYLAHRLSRSVEHSQQRSRELAQLEALGEAIIQAPPDLSTLGDLLEQHLNRMFPQDRVEIKMFDPVPQHLPGFHIRNTPQRPPADNAVWERLRDSSESHFTQPNLRLSGTDRLGSGVAVKIEADNPGQEGGQKEMILGGVYLLRVKMLGKASTSLPAVQALASQIGSAYYRALAHRETLAAQRMTQELELAGRIQSKFLPTTIPHLDGWDIAAGLIPARQTSGDFYDFIALDNGHLGLLVADVADKGTGAALFMALSRTLIRTYAMQYPDDPAQVLQAANARILTDAESEQFVTVFYAVLDPATGTLTYANAGHNPAYVINSGDPCSLTKTGIPLGLFDDFPWQQRTIQLAPGDVLVLYTDGVSEAQNAAQEEFRETRLLDVLQSHRDRPSQVIYAAVMDAVHGFVSRAPQFDDITLMVVARS